jgi:hopanoid biosynthesis associated radical SAM protein HpnJ
MRGNALPMKTLFLNPPSFEGFDGGAGARYQAKREIRSFWYPTWLAQPAALVPDSRLVDAPARGLALEDVAPLASDYELAVLYASTPSIAMDLAAAHALKETNPKIMIGLVGPHVAVAPAETLAASAALDFVAGTEFDFTIQDVAEGRPLEGIDGISWRNNGAVVHNRPRAILEDMDLLPHVVDVYRRDLVIGDYFIGYLLHPYISIYTGRGCKSRCTFCLWPQTIGGHRYRTRSVDHVVTEVAKAKAYFPQVKEYFFDDDTFTDDLPRAEAIARRLCQLGVRWSCNAKANVPYDSLKAFKDNGLRLLLVGYESGNQQILHNIKKGMRVDWARRFSEDCHKLGIDIHGAFIVGLPGETKETIQETIRFAKEINPKTLQVSLAAAYPGTYMYEQAKENGWLLDERNEHLVGDQGIQISSLSYPHLSHDDIFAAVSEFYRKFYFRPSKILEITGEMLRDWDVMKRRLREGREFMSFLAARENRTRADA